jgi:hypothetical protein
MTAQRGKDASDRWRDLADDIEASVLASGASILRGNGRQIIELPNRSRIRPFAPTRDGLHGSSPHFVLIDEAWSFTEERGEQLMAAVDPAQVTHRDRQTWIISAAGDLTSVWWNELCNKGRAATEDKASTIAYFEWSMRAGADPYNPASWGFHPGLDGLISVDDLAAAAQTNSLGNFLRSYMNTRTSTRDAIIPMDAWNAAPKPARPSAAAIVYGYAAAIDRSHASIYGAWRDASDRLCLHVYKTAEGIDWLVPTLTELAGKGAALVADDGGFTRVITDQLQRASVPVQTLAGRDQGTAWAAFKQSALSVHHDHSQALTEALSVAQEAPRGDHYIVSRRHSLGAIDALEAAYVGLWFVDRLRPPLVIY